MRRIALACLVALGALLGYPGASAAPAALPPVKHVFIVVLENQDFGDSFGKSSPAPYLARTLPRQGQLLTQYHGTSHESLGNYLTMISGQPPNIYTQADAPAYIDFVGTVRGDGVAIGQGSVFPSQVKTIADQLDARGLRWKGYMQDMGNSASETKTCRHPALGTPDTTQKARNGDQYATRHNPFVYFHSIIDRPSCAQNDVPLDRLPGHLKSTSTTASYSFIVPNLCDDGHDAPCVDGRPGGLHSANEFLKKWIPRILASPAYKKDGVLIVTFDESASGAQDCCNEPPSPNTPNNGGPDPGNGGGRIGAVVLSRFTKPGSVNATSYNHYSLLRSSEDLLGLPHLAFAAQSGLKPFGTDVFNAPPRVSVAGVPLHGCAPSSFTARVKAVGTDVRALRVLIDGQRVTRVGGSQLSVLVRSASLGRGVHKLRGEARDAAGRRGTRTVHFRTCSGSGSGPSFTG